MRMHTFAFIDTFKVTAQYNLENADSEAEFNSLQSQLALVTAKAREQEVIGSSQLVCCLLFCC